MRFIRIDRIGTATITPLTPKYKPNTATTTKFLVRLRAYKNKKKRIRRAWLTINYWLRLRKIVLSAKMIYITSRRSKNVKKQNRRRWPISGTATWPNTTNESLIEMLKYSAYSIAQSKSLRLN